MHEVCFLNRSFQRKLSFFKQVSASAPSIISGYLFLLACQLRPSGLLSGDLYTSNQTTSKPIKRWFALHRDFVIYTFQSESDSHALTATPVPGYTLLTGEELTGDVVVSEKDRDKTIKMLYSPIQSCSQASLQSTAPECRKAYYFISDSVDETRRLETTKNCLLLCQSRSTFLFLTNFCLLFSFRLLKILIFRDSGFSSSSKANHIQIFSFLRFSFRNQFISQNVIESLYKLIKIYEHGSYQQIIHNLFNQFFIKHEVWELYDS